MISPALNLNVLLSGMSSGGNANISTDHSQGEFGSLIFAALGNLMKTTGGNSSALMGNLKLKFGTGQEFIENLKKFLLSKGFSLDKSLLGTQGLNILQNLLLKAGFDKDQLKQLFDTLKANSQDNGLRLGDVISALSELKAKTSNKKDINYFDISELPYIESILAAQGLDPEKIRLALDGAKIEGKGIDIQQLIKNLRKIAQQESDKYQQLATPQAGKQIQDLMLQMKAFGQSEKSDDGKSNMSGTITLDRFVQLLQEKLNHNQKESSDRQAASGELDALVKALKQSSSDSQGASHSVQNMIVAHRHGQKADSDEADVLNHMADEKGNKNQLANHLSKIKSASENGLANNDILNTKKQDEENKFSEALNSKKQGSNLVPSFGQSMETKMSNAKATPSGSPPSAKALPAYVLNQVARQLMHSIKNGENEVNLQLKPPHLGRLQMSIHSLKDSVSINIVAEQHHAREMIHSQLNELRASLHDQGIKLDKVDVQISYNFNQSMADAQNRSNFSNNGKRHHMTGETDELDTDLEINALPDMRTVPDRILDLMA